MTTAAKADGAPTCALTVNGAEREVHSGPWTRLLDVLREAIVAAAGPTATGDLGDAAARLIAGGATLSETMQYQPPPGIVWDDATYTGQAYPCYGWAACLVDLEVDLDTSEVTLLRCVHAVDVGKAINPVIVRGQIEGGTVQALGWALLEHIVYKDGRVANASMTNCIVPTFVDIPELETIIVECPYPFGPSGAKGVGEIPMDGPAAATIASRSARDARSTRPPTTIAVRDATVGPLSGTSSVDGSTTVIRSASTPSAPAAIWVKIVIAPWPMSVELAQTSNRPAAVARTIARPASRCSPEPVKPAPWK